MWWVPSIKKVAGSHGWSNVVLNDDFGKQLEGPAEWELISGAEMPAAAGFEVALKKFVATRFPSDAWAEHKEMLRNMSGDKDSVPGTSDGENCMTPCLRCCLPAIHLGGGASQVQGRCPGRKSRNAREWRQKANALEGGGETRSASLQCNSSIAGATVSLFDVWRLFWLAT